MRRAKSRPSKALARPHALKGYVPYASFERGIEENKDLYYKALCRTQTSLKGDKPDWQPWVGFFLRCLKKQKDSLASKLEREHTEQDTDAALPEISVQALKLLRPNERLKIAQIVEETGANRNTLKNACANWSKRDAFANTVKRARPGTRCHERD